MRLVLYIFGLNTFEYHKNISFLANSTQLSLTYYNRDSCIYYIIADIVIKIIIQNTIVSTNKLVLIDLIGLDTTKS